MKHIINVHSSGYRLDNWNEYNRFVRHVGSITPDITREQWDNMERLFYEKVFAYVPDDRKMHTLSEVQIARLYANLPALLNDEKSSYVMVTLTAAIIHALRARHISHEDLTYYLAGYTDCVWLDLSTLDLYIQLTKDADPKSGVKLTLTEIAQTLAELATAFNKEANKFLNSLDKTWAEPIHKQLYSAWYSVYSASWSRQRPYGQIEKNRPLKHLKAVLTTHEAELVENGVLPRLYRATGTKTIDKLIQTMHSYKDLTGPEIIYIEDEIYTWLADKAGVNE